MTTFHMTNGNMFHTPADIRVNTVNCVGVMGKGIALEFRNRYTAMFLDYQAACQRKEVYPGKLHIWSSTDTCIINLPTKRHWRDPSRYEDIEVGLVALRNYLSTLLPVRVTIPALGCGNGGLDWDQVLPMIQERLSCTGHDYWIFQPC